MILNTYLHTYKGDKPDIFGENHCEVKIIQLTEISFEDMKASQGRLTKCVAFEVLHNKGNAQRSLSELLGAWLWVMTE